MTNLSYGELRTVLENIDGDSFKILREIANFVGLHNYDSASRDLLIRLYDKRENFSNYGMVIDNLLREAGLFNYVEAERLSYWDRFAYGAHLAPSLSGDNNIVFHERQANVYHSLRRGENVILSAPTSFGKSIIIESYILISDFKNVVVIVPTIALIDQVRRRLSEIFGKYYKIITNHSQSLSERNIFVLTQERFLEFGGIPKPDFWVVDEFYKIADKKGDDRWKSLNIAVYNLLKYRTQFYLIGPNMGGLINMFGEEVNYSAYIETLGTVSSNVNIIDSGDPYSYTIDLCRSLDDATLIFCSSPARAAKLAKDLSAILEDSRDPDVSKLYSWCVDNYSEDWHFAKAIKSGIGVHHGKIPRSISQLAVEMFNRGKLKILICTSTLIEGVNTRAKNIVIMDNKISNKKIDFFTYNNIKGRSGRMGYHSVGNVYIFSIPPSEELLKFDIPFVVQTEETPINLISALSEDDLSEMSARRINEFEERTSLGYKSRV